MARHLQGTSQFQPRGHRDNKMLIVLAPRSVGEGFSQEIAGESLFGCWV